MSIPSFPTGPIGPATHIFAITPDNVAPQPAMKAIRADTAGTITFRAKDSPADVTWNLLQGEYIIAIVTHVRATGTTATLHGMG